MNLGLIVLFSLCNIIYCRDYMPLYDDRVEYRGKWFPAAPNEQDNNPTVDYIPRQKLNDKKHGIQMGIVSSDCDDGKTNLTIDWEERVEDYTCFKNRRYIPNPTLNPVITFENIPKKYRAIHKCMDTPILYDRKLPTFGTHRPLWAKYGEYLYLPQQRWLHNLEHGAVVMLYHPCTDNNEFLLLKKLVKGCLYRHIITPSTFLGQDRPMALVTWGNIMYISKVDPDVVKEYIMKNALHGPEKLFKNGQFDYKLIENARIVSDQADSNVCGNFINTMK